MKPRQEFCKRGHSLADAGEGTTRSCKECRRLWYINRRKTKPLYGLWLAIRNRCNNTRGQDYHYYGGRGIRVCSQWDSFAQFEIDVGPHPGRGWTLDRIDNNGHYEPGNVRWATRQTQARNRNYCILDRQTAEDIRCVYFGDTIDITQVELAEIYGVTQAHISAILRGALWR